MRQATLNSGGTILFAAIKLLTTTFVDFKMHNKAYITIKCINYHIERIHYHLECIFHAIKRIHYTITNIQIHYTLKHCFFFLSDFLLGWSSVIPLLWFEFFFFFLLLCLLLISLAGIAETKNMIDFYGQIEYSIRSILY